MRIAANYIQDIEVSGSERGWHSLITDFIGAKTLDRNNAGKLGNFFRQAERNRRMAVRGGRTGGPEIEIGGQLVAHPEHNALAETSYHDADRGHHRNGGRECADQNGSSAQGGREATRGKHRFHAEKLSEKFRGK